MKFLPKIWYNTPSILNPKSWKLPIQWHENASFSHMSFLDFNPQRIWTSNYRLIHHICMSQHPQTHRIFLIQIRYKSTSRLKPKSIKTSDTRALVCNLSIHVFQIFWLIENVYIIFLPHNHKTNINFLIQIWYKATSILKTNPWKLIIQEHGKCEPFIHVFLIFQLTKNMEKILHIHAS